MFKTKWRVEAAKKFRELQEAATKARTNREVEHRTKASKQEGLFRQVLKTIQLLEQNPRHPGLQTHDYNALQNPYDKDAKVFEAYAQHRTPGAYRVFWCYGPDREHITILAITPHP